MKYFATTLAATMLLATSVFAQQSREKPFALTMSHENEEEIFVGIEIDNPVTLKLPRVRAPRGSGTQCTGWQLADEDEEYDDFDIEVVSGRRSTSFVLTAIQATQQNGDYVQFVNTCSADENGVPQETREILVGVYPFRED